MYSTMNPLHMNNQNNSFNYSQMNQMNPMSQYPSQAFFPQPSQYVIPSASFPQNISNNCTQENFSQMDENFPNSFSQMIKNNLENAFKKIPENCYHHLMEKVNGKFKKLNEEIVNFKKNLNESNNRIEKKLGKLPNCLEIVEDELNEINSKLNKFKELVNKNQNHIEIEIQKIQNSNLDRIAFERENEKKLIDSIDQIEILKINISNSIRYAQTEIKKNLDLNNEAFLEIKNLIYEKLKELKKEVSGIQVGKFPTINIKTSNEFNMHSSVKKIQEIKTILGKIQNNQKIKEMKKESFSLLYDKENNIKNTNIKFNFQSLEFDFHKKRKFKDFSFYEL
jgi:hypothetical protein